jgi:hypothetical protein
MRVATMRLEPPGGGRSSSPPKGGSPHVTRTDHPLNAGEHEAARVRGSTPSRLPPTLPARLTSPNPVESLDGLDRRACDHAGRGAAATGVTTCGNRA